MSSPPPNPPPPNPLKRTSISSASTSQNPSKRPRMHPLRQTSFPVDPDLRAFSATAASDAGSVTGSFTGSVGGASADGVFRKKRGRKSKAEKEREQQRERERERERDSEDAVSVARGGPGAAGAGGRGGDNAGEEGDEEDDFDDEGDLLGREEGGEREDKEGERKNLALLVDAFNPLQSERYDLFKRAKLRKETLRRIVNHALSQSVPASVVTTINGFTKVFAGEMIEKARTVQKEWAEAHDQAALARLNQAETAAAEEANQEATSNEHQSAVKQEPTDMPVAGAFRVSAPGGKATVKLPPNPHRGQLLPSHLREAVRRYKRDGEGGGVGFSGLSLGNLGTRGSVTWNAGSVGGRPLFR
ncbi:transcription initiation factor TFIID subunit 11 family protein [Aspergillus stella-maris]|uniref:transcription initiation factor TFIID subunit 11 family protein n=1 Tax=Aspergillus stella-maris TaxID=1810926 RepID=UPI003CCD1C7C